MAGSSLLLPRILGRVDDRTRTPWIAIAVCGLLSAGFLFAGDIAFVANVTNFTLFVTFIVINAAVIALRYRAPQIARPFKIPLAIGALPVLPVAGLVFCIFLLFQQDWSVLALGLGLTLTGVPFTLAGTGRGR
jgi:APA family basic amino acid/polyamine antiporter